MDQSQVSVRRPGMQKLNAVFSIKNPNQKTLEHRDDELRILTSKDQAEDMAHIFLQSNLLEETIHNHSEDWAALYLFLV